MQSINLYERPNVRQFRIVSQKGYILDLLDKNSLGVSFEGLGVTFEDTTLDSHTTKRISTRVAQLGEITFQLVLGAEHDPYQTYERVMRCLNDSHMTLEYTVPGVGTYHKDIVMKSIAKAEITQYRVLACDIVLQSMSLWYKWRDVSWGEVLEPSYFPKQIKPQLNDNIGDKLDPWTTTAQNDKTTRILYNNSVYMDDTATSSLYLEIPGGTLGLGSDPVLLFYTPEFKLKDHFGVNFVIKPNESLYMCSDYAEMWCMARVVDEGVEKVIDITPRLLADSAGLHRVPTGTTVIHINTDKYPHLKFALSDLDSPEECITIRIKEEWVTI